MSGQRARWAVRERLDVARIIAEHPLECGISPREDLAAVRRFCREERDCGVMHIARALRAHDLNTALAERTESTR